MHTWYEQNRAKCSKYVKSKIIPSEPTMQEIMLYAMVDNTIYDLKNNPSKLTLKK